MQLSEFMKLNESSGQCFFSPETMQFFGSKVRAYDPLTGYFITREKKCFDSMKIGYTIRKADFKTGNVETIGKFLEFDTYQKAKVALMRIIKPRLKGLIEIL